MLKNSLIALAMTGAVIAITAGACSPDTHVQGCARPGQGGSGPIVMEPDACDRNDDDYNSKAKKFYVADDQRWDTYEDLDVGDAIPAGIGSFTKPTGPGVQVRVQMDD